MNIVPITRSFRASAPWDSPEPLGTLLDMSSVLLPTKSPGTKCLPAGSDDNAKAKAAYNDFLTLWKDADSDIPILEEANAEYAKLKQAEHSPEVHFCESAVRSVDGFVSNSRRVETGVSTIIAVGQRAIFDLILADTI